MNATPQPVQRESVVQMLFVVTPQEDFLVRANQDLQETPL